MRFVLRTLILFIGFCSLLEIGCRLAEPVSRLVPYDASQGYPSLPRRARLKVQLSDGAPVEYVTDDRGARVASVAAREREADALVVGDSQALGYDIPFEQTAAAQWERCAGFGAVAVAAAPASDVEDYLLRIADELRMRRSVLRLALFINLGNDLNETFVTGQWKRGDRGLKTVDLLLEHSRAYQRAVLAWQERSLSRATVPGVGRLLYELSADERMVLVDAIAARMLTLTTAIEVPSPLIVVIPNDIDIEPTELSKYSRYASSDREFASWLAQASALSLKSGAMRRLLVARLKAGGMRVLDLHARFSGMGARAVYSRASHHLTPEANQAVADELCKYSEPVSAQ